MEATTETNVAADREIVEEDTWLTVAKLEKASGSHQDPLPNPA